jgi:1-acyl-sn-glycerol-3-phosphate acyltransferase
MIIIKFLFILILFWVIGSIIWYYQPTLFLNIKYNTISDKKIEDFKGPFLIIASHAYCHADSIIVCSESRKSQNKFNIIALRNWKEPFRQFFREFPLFTSYNKINVDDKIKNNTVEKAVNKIKNNENVVILYPKYKNKKGLYYILEKTKVPILFLRIYKKDKKYIEDYKQFKNNKDLINIVNTDFELDYEEVKDYPIDKKPEEFMEWVEDKIYNLK